MILYKQDKPHCLATSAAMVIGHLRIKEPTDILNDFIRSYGDGLEKIWDYDDNRQFRGHHPVEVMQFALKYSVAFVWLQKDCLMAPSLDAKPISVHVDLDKYRCLPAIYIGELSCYKNRHAVAWDGEQIFDPNGLHHDRKDMRIEHALLGYKYI